MIKHFCDICGKEFNLCDDIERFKLKKEFHAIVSGWERLEIHRDCYYHFCDTVKAFKNELEERERNGNISG